MSAAPSVDEPVTMAPELAVALLIVAAVIVWVIAKVIHYSRLSERQWQQVDRSRLRPWEDDDDA